MQAQAPFLATGEPKYPYFGTPEDELQNELSAKGYTSNTSCLSIPHNARWTLCIRDKNPILEGM